MKILEKEKIPDADELFSGMGEFSGQKLNYDEVTAGRISFPSSSEPAVPVHSF